MVMRGLRGGNMKILLLLTQYVQHILQQQVQQLPRKKS